MSESGTRYPQLTLPKHVAVYTPATPLRVVDVFIDDRTGEATVEEVAVLGIQAVIKECYTHPPISGGKCDPVPRSFAPQDIAAAGYRPDDTSSSYVAHHIVIWDYEYGAVALGDGLLDRDTYLIGPASAPDWERRIAERAAELNAKHRREREAVAA